MKKILPILVLSIYLLSCQSNTTTDNAVSDPEPLTFMLTELWRTDTIMRTPESVLFDPANNVLYVANLNLNTEEEGDGFISKLGTDGSIIDLHWVSGLKGPKGMGIYDKLLFVSDVNDLVIIDLELAEIKETIPVDSADFMNDLVVDKDGKVYFTDSGTGKIHVYANGKVSDWYTEDLHRPNGLYLEKEDIILSSSISSDVKRINKETKEVEIMAEGIGHGDGMKYAGIEDYYIVSSWKGEVFIIGKDTVQSVLDTKEQKINAADFGYNLEKKILYLPTFFDNRVVAYKLDSK